MSYKQWLSQAKAEASHADVETTAVEWLLLDLLKWTRVNLLIDGDTMMSETDKVLLNSGLERLLSGEPVQYITGEATFYGRTYHVDSRVLIPRPETEEVFATFIEQCPKSGCIADIGTGSGIIALTLQQECPHLEVWASDISPDALAVTRQNAERHHVSIQLLEGSVLNPFIEKGIRLDGLISNPPYIGRDEIAQMGQSVVAHEPHLALFAEDDGYAIYDALLSALPKVMNDDAPIVFEIGYQQGAKLCDMAKQYYPHLEPKVISDINGNPRIFYMQWKIPS
ncbi:MULTISPECIES: peptide chain release factor N(5)-glutamine methyltransferase [unclassified Staphylococcus]|uniref:peptide chain release factor N(5)-glutamine methyltransferase n=1 Tax=unclassified Staphylococcus TaxID=91994 RepID=UPI0021D1F944|nr:MULTISPECIES: peptide chain release factor N(5)-glutamine methyltransferase [unclassified Staphylococcus]UXR71201.1 peptide chain release factor N(5)-glutamine methyltransferase [Staphylococcus sp. IVB6240]UXR73474.1 peptide chain release factor N(5)-glutamine methyltransferase [Staphylococcus sp. IVB6238]UXR75792.1 peptide chain release factor N(5)-glutamine methyltransferase [Staphylococcus sp. IVB6233]UXR79991.1 peptide chain release factor N(5)-glutamine methyltransferase [Staphylococcus